MFAIRNLRENHANNLRQVEMMRRQGTISKQMMRQLNKNVTTSNYRFCVPGYREPADSGIPIELFDMSRSETKRYLRSYFTGDDPELLASISYSSDSSSGNEAKKLAKNRRKRRKAKKEYHKYSSSSTSSASTNASGDDDDDDDEGVDREAAGGAEVLTGCATKEAEASAVVSAEAKMRPANVADSGDDYSAMLANLGLSGTSGSNRDGGGQR